MEQARRTSRALRFVLLIGIMSFFADLTYEGSRGIVGPYLALLGASAAAVAIITGFGELLGYGLRLVSGGLSDKTGQFWPVTIGGYIIQMASVPLLALAGNWQMAAVLVILERVGKAIRNPPRDVMLSHAAKEMGYGWGFGVHEALTNVEHCSVHWLLLPCWHGMAIITSPLRSCSSLLLSRSVFWSLHA